MKLFRYLQELLDEWILHQRNWIYLEPIFSSSASQAALPKEGKMFSNANSSWRKIMKRARDSPGCRHWAEDFQNRAYINILRNNNLNFDLIQKALDEYLERKRENFQRFFFLSNDELLEILSQAKTPKDFQMHLRKIFENIASLEFEEKVEIANAMVSGKIK